MLPTISIAICTRNHPDELANCLQSLVPIRDQAKEIIVVDNASDGDATRKVVEAFGAIYVREPIIGLEPARNRAIIRAAGEIIAFTDDDCQVDAGWLDAIAQAFSDPMVGAVTGQAISGKDANWVQRQFNSYSRGFCSEKPVERTPAAVGDFYYRAVLGVGANMAYRRNLLFALDGFPDVTRGAGDDDYMMFSIVRAGYKVRYTPDSIVYQKHRSGVVSTLARMFEYGRGNMCVLWFLSAEDRKLALFFKNCCWMLYGELRHLFSSVVYVRPWHVLFSLANFFGIGAGLFIPWGWRAHIFGELPVRGGLRRDAESSAGSNASRANRALSVRQRLFVRRGAEKATGGVRHLERNYAKVLPILIYHRVGPVEPGTYPALTVDPERFKNQMLWLKRNGYTTIRTGDWLAWCFEGKPLPARPVLLTFDDAYADLVEFAFPVLQENAFTATVFVVTKEIGGHNSWDQENGSATIRCMSADHIRQWSGRGIEFGAHTRTHPDLTALSESELEEEIAGSGRDMGGILGTFPLSFAYPFGAYNDAVRSCTEKFFQLAFTCDEGVNGLGTPPHLLHRTMVQPGDSLLDLALRLRFGWNPILRLRARLRLRTRMLSAAQRLHLLKS